MTTMTTMMLTKYIIVGDDPVCKSCGNFGHRSHRDHRCPDHHCAHCRKQGHGKRFCPDVQCPHCDLFGHVNKVDCKYKHCINVDVDWLNMLLQFNAHGSGHVQLNPHRSRYQSILATNAGPNPSQRHGLPPIVTATVTTHAPSHLTTPAMRIAVRDAGVYTGPVSKRWHTPARTHAWRTGATLSPSRLSS